MTDEFDESVLDLGQKDIIKEIRKRGLELDARTFVDVAFMRDIEDLTAEELASVPTFLLDPYLEERDRASS